MITLDVTGFGKKLTLEDCAKLYDDVVNMLSPMPVKLGVKERVRITPDNICVTKWQHENILSSLDKPWRFWRGMPIVVQPEELENDRK